MTPSVEELEQQLKPGGHDTYVGKGDGWKYSSGDIKDAAGWWPGAKGKLNCLLKLQKGDNPAVKQLRRRVAALPSDVRYCRAGILEGCPW